MSDDQYCRLTKKSSITCQRNMGQPLSTNNYHPTCSITFTQNQPISVMMNNDWSKALLSTCDNEKTDSHKPTDSNL